MPRTGTRLKLAHFSDLHLGSRCGALTKTRMRALLDHAIAGGVEHLLFGGDIVDHANLHDAVALREHLETRGFLSSERVSVVPGNHDIWPIGEGDLFGGIIDYLKQNATSLPTLTGWPPHQRHQKFVH